MQKRNISSVAFRASATASAANTLDQYAAVTADGAGTPVAYDRWGNMTRYGVYFYAALGDCLSWMVAFSCARQGRNTDARERVPKHPLGNGTNPRETATAG